MSIFNQLLSNQILVSGAVGWTVAQVLKTLIHLFFTKKFVAERLVGSGGMPSSHSATVCALTTAAYMSHGLSSSEFAICFFLAAIVMYDAIGVRRETGIQAKVLNDMIKVLDDMGSDMPPQEKLKEFVGHTPFQVLVGGILGIILAILICS
ncbi:MAG: divergent PAP2 family protein [Lachnospiraceae bacterium]|nr:divergent PAP2 family protein [Lachnospiraceae bacterium]